jgi:hypothetical protein
MIAIVPGTQGQSTRVAIGRLLVGVLVVFVGRTGGEGDGVA